MALELNRLAGQVNEMGRILEARQQHYGELIKHARSQIVEHGEVTEELRDKVARAHDSDQSWRGAEPREDRMDGHLSPGVAVQPVILVAADGSQIYPDRHGIATYYLVNTGSIILRQESGQAPSAETRPLLFFEDRHLYDDAGRLRDSEYINQQRDRQEMATLVELAESERSALGGDVSRPILALTDGPLLPWTPQRARSQGLDQEVVLLTEQLDRLQRARAIPVGYIDRPGSAYVLRTLELTYLAKEEINRTMVRKGHFRLLADRLLFGDLAPNERSRLFASTSEMNDRYRAHGHRILFFYANMSRRPGPQNAIIARIELPEWAADAPGTVDLVQQALYADSTLTGYPYVLARAHELAVVGTAERLNLEGMLQHAMLQRGLDPATSAKARQKRLLGSKGRS